MARAVGVARPESLRVAEVAVHVLPAVVEDAAVGQDGGVSLEERGDADLVDVRAVRLHAVEVAHDVAVAHAVLRVARGREHDVAVRQERGVDVAHALRARELAEVRAVRVHDVDVIIVGTAVAHRKHDPLPVPVHLRVADGAPFLLRHDHARCTRRGVPRLERALRPVAPLVDLAALEDGRRVVVVRLEYSVRHIDDLWHGRERRLCGGLRAGLLGLAEIEVDGRRTLRRRLGVRIPRAGDAPGDRPRTLPRQDDAPAGRGLLRLADELPHRLAVRTPGDVHRRHAVRALAMHGNGRRTRTRREVRRAAHALARHVVQRHVSPAAGRVVGHAEVDVLADRLRHVPRDRAHPLAVLADGRRKHLARRAVDELEARVPSAADLEGDRRTRQTDRRRLDQASLPVVRAVVLALKRRDEVRAALRVRLSRVVLLREVGHGPRERALRHLPPLQVARLEVVDNPLRQNWQRHRKCRTSDKNYLIPHKAMSFLEINKKHDP